MLNLDSDRWNELSHAYGRAFDIPDILRQLLETVEEGVHTDTWFYLWNALCQQSDVYPASYAAVPYIVDYAAGCSLGERTRGIHFAASVEGYRHRPDAPAIPYDLVEAYDRAIRRLPDLVCMSSHEPWDQDTTQVMIAALAIAKGYSRLGLATMELEPEIDCPACEALFAPRGWALEE
jgi:hypothetical protein